MKSTSTTGLSVSNISNVTMASSSEKEDFYRIIDLTEPIDFTIAIPKDTYKNDLYKDYEIRVGSELTVIKKFKNLLYVDYTTYEENRPKLEIPKLSYRENYETALKAYEDAGFKNISLEKEIGQVASDHNTVTKIMVDGTDVTHIDYNDFTKTHFLNDVPITIKYADSSEIIATMERNNAESKKREELAKDPNNYISVDYNAWIHNQINMGTLIVVSGEVLELRGGENPYVRLGVNGDYTRDIYVSIDREYYNSNIIAQGDTLTIYGTNIGRKSYVTVLGSERTIPQLDANFYNIVSYGN